VIYLDASVALAQLLAEEKLPPGGLWSETVISSRLLQYETWVVLHARKLSESHGEELRTLLGRISFLELEPRILARAMEPFPSPLRTLDALHLASLAHLRDHGQSPRLASYDGRLVGVARRMKFEVFRL
jgi:hypothetical protein